MPLDIPFARKVLDYARQEHDDFNFDMSHWYMRASWIGTGGQRHCGTAACLAGTAVFLHPEVAGQIRHDNLPMFSYQGKIRHPSYLGQELLGLTDEDYLDEDGSPLIFYMDNRQALDTLERYITEAEAREAASYE